ncbi:MAG: amino acid permease [Flavobacterium sp.]|nr:amino acid permease [Pedobacter sp.]
MKGSIEEASQVTKSIHVTGHSALVIKNGVPKSALSLLDAIALIVGIVIGAGIFRSPSLVAANSDSDTLFMFFWLAGGVVSLIGALCYAELTTAFPDTGGDYHFLSRAFGKRLSFLFAWSRLSIIQTGSIALLAFIFGDYASQVYSLGQFSSVIYAAVVVILLTAINCLGITFGAGTQKLLTSIEVLGILLIIIVGFFMAPEQVTSIAVSPLTSSNHSSAGLAMVIVLLTFGGWNEAAYISSELRSGKKQLAKALIISLIVITIIYLLINMAYLRVLGLSNMAGSEAVAIDLMRISMGEPGVILIGVLVAVSALTSANASIFTGARTNYSLGRDFRIFSGMGRWNSLKSVPLNAYLIQGLISLGLISLGLFTRSGFETMIEYTAPVFWFFFLMVGLSLFILRRKEPYVERPFRVPFYPITPALFCLTSAYLLYSSVMYSGIGAFLGIGVLLIGLLLILIFKIKNGEKSS